MPRVVSLQVVHTLQVRRCVLEFFLEGSTVLKPSETESNNRSVMPLDALGRTRATMPDTAGVSSCSERNGQPSESPLAILLCAAPRVLSHRKWRAWAWGLQLSPTNEECLVAVGH